MISLSKVIFSLLLIFSFSGCAHKEIDIDDYLNLKMRSKNIDEMIDKKTNGALKEHKRAISDIIDYLDYAIKKGVEIGEEKFNLLKKKVFDIEASTEDTLKSITESKISFNPGKSNLSARDKTKIDQNVKRILNLEKKILKKESKEQFVILVKIRGYTDELPFNKSKLPRYLKGYLSRVGRMNTVEERKYLNQKLSEKRALNVKDYIAKILEKESLNDIRVQFNFEVIGFGETINKELNLFPPYNVSDPRRRVSVIYITHIKKEIIEEYLENN